jgi:hypothetical protein
MARRCSRRAVAVAVTALLVVLGAGRIRAQLLPRDESQKAVSGTVPSSSSGAGGPTGRTVTAEQQRPNRPAGWTRLHLPDPVARHAAHKALDEAWQLLAQRDCSALLTRFSDSSGRPLAQHLESLSVDPQTYLTLVVFIDGSREVACNKGGLAFTAPGSRVVRLCVDELKRTWQQSPEHTVASFIHEMLHTLGLGENPPSSKEITQRVLAACHRYE